MIGGDFVLYRISQNTGNRIMVSPKTVAISPVAMLIASCASTQFAEQNEVTMNMPLVTFEMEYKLDEFSGVGELDTSKQPGDRMIVLSPTKEKQPRELKKSLSDTDLTQRGYVWCESFKSSIPEPALAKAQPNNPFSFTPKDSLSDAWGMKKLAENLSGTATVDDQKRMTSYKLVALEPFKLNFATRLDAFELDIECGEYLGHMFSEQMKYSISGKLSGVGVGTTVERKLFVSNE